MPEYNKQFDQNFEKVAELVKEQEIGIDQSKGADWTSQIHQVTKDPTVEPVSSEGTKLKVDPPLLNLREEPAGKIIAQLNRGDLLEVDDDTIAKEGHQWCLVYSSSGLTGYVQRQFLSKPE